MKKMIRAVHTKGVNSLHLSKEGVLNHGELCNLIRPHKHGLVAKVKGEAGAWLITQKGAAFLRGEPVPKYAVQDKTTGHIEGYWEPGGMVTINELRRSTNDPYWEGADTRLVDGARSNIASQQATLI